MAIPRTVAKCDQYLDVLARIVEHAGDEGAVYLPLYHRLMAERAAAERDEGALSALLARRRQAAPR